MVDAEEFDLPHDAKRVEPVSTDELWSILAEPARSRFDDRRAGMNIYRTIGRNPDLLNAWLPMGGYLLWNNPLPPNERELVILRTARNCGSRYEWTKHVALAHKAGVSDGEIAAIGRGDPLDSWPSWPRALLRAADDLHTDSVVSDEAWSELSAHYTTEQLLALVMLIGQYHLVAFVLRSAGVQLEE